MSRLRLHRLHIVPVVAMLLLITSGAHAGNKRVLPAMAPSLITAAPMVDSPGAVSVSGQDFTPGGEVVIALYDRWGVQHYESRRAIASDAAFGLNGSQDPALGYIPGGSIRELFGASEPVYGPGGSQDPATGYVSGVDSVNLCGASLMVRAYDARTDQWSNVFDVDPAC